MRTAWVALCRKCMHIHARPEQGETRRKHHPDLATDSDNSANNNDDDDDDELRGKQKPFAVWAWQNIDHKLLLHSIHAETPGLVNINGNIFFRSLQKLFDAPPPPLASVTSALAQRHDGN